MKSKWIRGTLLALLLAIPVSGMTSTAEAAPRDWDHHHRDHNDYWNRHWQWYNRSYRPYYNRQYQRYYVPGRTYYYTNPGSYYYSPYHRPSGGSINVGPLHLHWR